MDIDSEDADNELAAMEYVEDIYKFYKLTEVYIWWLLYCFFVSFYNLYVWSS